MTSHGTYSLSHNSSQPGNESSRHSFTARNWYGSSSSQPRCFEPSSYVNYGGHSAHGGYGSCRGPSSHGRMGCHNTSGGFGSLGAYGGPGGPGGFGNPGGSGIPGGHVSWCTPGPNSSPQWGPSWGN